VNPTGGGRKSYVKVNLPKNLADIIDSIVKEGMFGYRSRDEFVADAVRRRLEQLGILAKQKS